MNQTQILILALCFLVIDLYVMYVRIWLLFFHRTHNVEVSELKQ